MQSSNPQLGGIFQSFTNWSDADSGVQLAIKLTNVADDGSIAPVLVTSLHQARWAILPPLKGHWQSGGARLSSLRC